MRALLLAAALSSLLPARSSTGLGTLDDSKCDRRPYAAMQPLDLADLRGGSGAESERVSSLKFSTQYGMNAGIARNGCIDLDGVLRLFEPPPSHASVAFDGDGNVDDDRNQAGSPLTDLWAAAEDWRERLSHFGQYGFKYGWQIDLFPGGFKSSEVLWNEGFAVVARPAFGRNVGVGWWMVGWWGVVG